MSICYIGNIASHYRANIFSRMCNDLSCDFYFGQPKGISQTIKTLPLSFFSTHAEMLQNVYFPRIGGFWQKNAVKLLRNKYDVYIITGDLSCYSTWVILLLNYFFYHKRIVLWGHGWYGRESFSKTIIKKVYYALSDRILVYGDRAKQLMEKQGINSKKIFVVHNSLDYEQQQDVIKHLPLSNPIQNHFKNEYPCIIFTGRLMPPKRIDMILEALSQLKREKTIINCVFVGDGPEKQNLESIVSRLNLKNQVWFYGACYDELIIGSLYWHADLCVSPGNVGLTAIHSLTYGCPVVTHNDFANQMPEFEAIIPGKTGDFFDHGNVASLKETILKWIDLSRLNKPEIQQHCFQTVQEGWTPDYQVRVLKECCTF